MRFHCIRRQFVLCTNFQSAQNSERLFVLCCCSLFVLIHFAVVGELKLYSFCGQPNTIFDLDPVDDIVGVTALL